LTAIFGEILCKYMTDNLPKFSLETAIKKAEERNGRGPVKSLTLWIGESDVIAYDKLQKGTKNAFGKYLKEVVSQLIKQNINDFDKAS
jgi:hypothetical protein